MIGRHPRFTRTDTLFPYSAVCRSVMVTGAGSDRHMPNSELRSMGELVKYLPIFRDYDQDRLTRDASACGQVLNEDDGLDRVLDQIEASLPESLRETDRKSTRLNSSH